MASDEEKEFHRATSHGTWPKQARLRGTKVQKKVEVTLHMVLPLTSSCSSSSGNVIDRWYTRTDKEFGGKSEARYNTARREICSFSSQF